MKRLPQLVAEEAGWDKPPKDVPVARSLRWALLHGEAFTAEEAAERFDVSPTMLSQALHTLREHGWVTATEPIVGANGSKRYRIDGYQPSKPKPPKRQPAAPLPPPLGATLRVVMAAFEGDAIALVLVDGDGNRWPVTLAGPPL